MINTGNPPRKPWDMDVPTLPEREWSSLDAMNAADAQWRANAERRLGRIRQETHGPNSANIVIGGQGSVTIVAAPNPGPLDLKAKQASYKDFLVPVPPADVMLPSTTGKLCAAPFCDWCGARFVGTSKEYSFCSERCRDANRNYRNGSRWDKTPRGTIESAILLQGSSS